MQIMQLHRYRLGSTLILPSSVVTIGNFDGLHLGHQVVLNKTIKRAKQLNLPSVLILFEPQPLEFLLGAKTPARLTRLREKIMLLQKMAIDHVIVITFNEQMAKLRAHEFIQTVLINQLQVKHIIVGNDFRFGFQREGDFELLESFGKKFNFLVENCEEFKIADERVSSSRIRQVLAASDLALAEKLLGRRYSLSGRFCHGNKTGRTIGFPTANLFLHRTKSPVLGIYVVQMRGIDDLPLNGVANIGTRPTVQGTRVLLEVFLFDFNRDIYGRHVEVDILHKLRDEEHYESLEALRFQICLDVEQAKAYFNQFNKLP